MCDASMCVCVKLAFCVGSRHTETEVFFVFFCSLVTKRYRAGCKCVCDIITAKHTLLKCLVYSFLARLLLFVWPVVLPSLCSHLSRYNGLQWSSAVSLLSKCLCPARRQVGLISCVCITRPGPCVRGTYEPFYQQSTVCAWVIFAWESCSFWCRSFHNCLSEEHPECVGDLCATHFT